MTWLAMWLTATSIIFTCWTRTLDLIEIYLTQFGLNACNYQRIDGDCTTLKREKILNRFSKDPDTRILIMTTGTGAVG
jgi:SWI/SNF-related matrix-associated actin-dependent regulator of chromatin subfamily A3